MIEIKSYLRMRDGRFVLVGDVGNPPSDPYHVEGAVELTINGVPIIDREMWDYVDQLWAYLGDMVLRFREKGEASTYFPDQPIKLSFSRHGRGRVLVSLAINRDSRAASVEEDELIEALRHHGISFFDKMKILLPDNVEGYEDALDRLCGYPS